MSLLNTGMNALGTFAVAKSLFGGKSEEAKSKVNRFFSEIRASGVARTNLFDVVITPPKMMNGNKTVNKISLYAEGASVTGRSIQTADLKRYGIGPQEKIPYSMQYNDITLTFIGDGKGEVYKFFYNWMQGIVRGDSGVTTYDTEKDGNGKTSYEVEFKSNYATNIIVTTYNEQGDPVLYTRLIGAFPISVPDISLSWSDSGMMQFSVTFAYLQSQLADTETPIKVGKGGVEGLSALQKLVKIGTAVQAISALKRPRNIQDALASSTSIKNITSGF
jgi:hypothetical protein